MINSHKIRNVSAPLSVLAGAMFALAGCGGGGSGESTGIVSLAVSDAPIHDAEKVCIRFDGVEFFLQDLALCFELGNLRGCCLSGGLSCFDGGLCLSFPGGGLRF